MQPFSFLEFDMNTPAWITLIALGLVAIPVIAGFVMREEPHTTEDDDEQLRNIQPDWPLTERIKHANKQVRTRIRLGRSWRNLFGLWSN
jgi:hypothetical protein